MPVDRHARLIERDGRVALLFERALPHTPERVWQALSSRAELLEWHPTPCELEPRRGGLMDYAPCEGAPAMPAGVVLAYEPPCQRRRSGHTAAAGLSRARPARRLRPREPATRARTRLRRSRTTTSPHPARSSS